MLQFDTDANRVDSDARTTEVLGKVEFVRDFANAYGATTQPGIGNVFNHALAKYVNDHLAHLQAADQRTTTTAFGANLIGDPAFVMPMAQPAAKDNQPPPPTDTNPRAADVIAGYPSTPQYNSQGMPVHVITHTEPMIRPTGPRWTWPSRPTRPMCACG